MFRFFKNLFRTKLTPILHDNDYTIVSKRDKSGRYRYSFYVNNKLVKRDMTIHFSRKEALFLDWDELKENSIQDGKRKIVC